MLNTAKSVRSGAMVLFVIAVTCLGLAAQETNGQGTRRKRVPPASNVPAVPAGGAQIISRAADFPDTETVLVPKPEETPSPTSSSDPDENGRLIEELRNRITGLEAAKKEDKDEKQKRLLLNLDILNRAEQRSESLRKQLFDMIEKESNIKTKLDLIDTNLRPEAIEREVAFAGTLRPEDLRAHKKKQLEVERTNLQSILAEVQKTRTSLEQNLQRSESMVEKLRVRLEKEIDDALADDPIKP